ncbi:MAG: ZIP family metal transporter [Clostridiaceae bacterium]|jgi:ZIP family zinc transporter|nr:ZIP family metal transporter [Clostridiaceae bacterium]
MSMNWMIIAGLIVPGIMTGVGAIPALFARDVPRKWLDVMLGFAAGVMLAATCFSLILPSIEYGGNGISAVLVTAAGIAVGAAMIDLIDYYAPHEHLINKHHEGVVTDSLKKIWLFVIAITIHNIPEGLAVGVAFGSANPTHGLPIAIGIGLQNMPEGLAVAFALMREKYSAKMAFFIALITGIIEPVMAFMGFGLVRLFKPALPFILALAAGAMLFVIVDEVIPETHSSGNERAASYAMTIGFIIMMVLDIALG